MAQSLTLFQDTPLKLALGGELSPIQVAYQTYGTLNQDKSNVVLLCHALTGDAEPYYAPPADKGWWQDFIGAGLAFDTNKYFFICSNVLGGCKGTTGPSSINPQTGKAYGSQFPIITVQDIVAVQKALMDKLGIPHLHAVAGGSFGGMQATQWGISYPEFVDNIINLCSSLTLSAEAIGFNHVMRQAVINDPNFNHGDYYDGTPPSDGLKLARMLGMLTYRTNVQLARAFGRETKQHGLIWGDHFQVESYLSYQGVKFLDRFDANSYLRLLRALDLYDPALGFSSEQEALSRIKAHYTLVGVTSDQLFKQIDVQKSCQRLEKAGVVVDYYEFHSDFGHDAFLVDYPFFEAMIRKGLGSIEDSN
ncbi:Homoserine O-acetyltransferase [Bibersteinia trehalosi USDA-ARS-USMARC-188]|uniref:Homoserine O-acetyltransferase n=3 Tax=Bibersteinia trehalosi TaxID=47735 RepID=W0R4Z5_BIBTR|nr:homoserine O-acetyltransferase [Bibersteinia trehalosi]AGH38199.1 Homoserine O-acetyltransferase [Bibersteinia trehalosi USDA-ARS-USMARC-192]AHG82000.1 Homoserine O-acetyltransferase [Bibersteinia trehalosi USDA-ARS-USMARC-188]AHG84304.1 Homoserine O-acetyltransferase [Bibersteinia trehalosi USDA-ARS-USMARC-189]AHG86189.1 Homoserine O-acetyltransferase [Bibersteinia trehalosi USDA-ARS-USMARC-190]